MPAATSQAARSIVIAGGGIGGLTAATALRRAGHQVEVIEIKDDWTVAGWGLSLTGPALRALAALGLDEACLDRGYGITQIANCDAAGHVRNVIDLPSLLGPGRPAQAGISRPDLSTILREAAEEAGATLRTACRIVDIADTGAGVELTLSDGSTRTADLLVGADGVWSGTRRLLGMTERPEFTGQMVWRAVVPRPEWTQALHTFAGATHQAGLIPISDDSAYLFVTENTDSADPVDDATLAEAMRELLAPFSGRVAEVTATVTDPDAVVRRPVQAVMVDGPWHVGHTVLIGDAAHTPSPQMVSGAALAIEDGIVLAQELTAEPDVEKALVSFGHRRLDRARRLVQTSLEIGRLERQGRLQQVHTLQADAHAFMAGAI